MSLLFLVRFLTVILAMLVAGVAGYMIARHRMRADTELQLSMMSAEIMKKRRRSGTSEAQARAAQDTLTRERRKNRRRA